MNCVLIPHRHAGIPSQKPRCQLQWGQRERRRGGTAAAVGEEDKEGEMAERRGRRRRARRWYEEGVKMGGVYTECAMQSVACS